MIHRTVHPGRPVSPYPHQKGMTLVELVMSVAILSILAGAAGSAIVIATRAAQLGAGDASEWPDTTEAADRIGANLEVAIGFTERTDTAVTFTVPDRDGDGAPETLRYAWSGIAGDPLVYQYNGGLPATIAQDVHYFDLSYLLRTVAGSPSGSQEQESEEMTLIFHDDTGGGQFGDGKVTTSKTVAQYFHPTLPTNATSWKITRVKFRAKKKKEQEAALLNIQIARSDVAQKPTSVVLETVEVPDSAIGTSYDWQEGSFSLVSGLDPSAGYCLVITGLEDTDGSVQFERNGSPMTPNTHWLTSGDGGATWTNPVDTSDMRFYVYGTVTTLGQPQWP